MYELPYTVLILRDKNTVDMQPSERIQKALAQEGVGSRRQIEAWIEEGLILVNGKPAVLGQKLSGSEKIKVRGRIIKLGEKQESKQLLLYNKPVGTICSRTQENDCETVFKDFPNLFHSRWVLIGRLDINTSGLLLVTNDGQLAHEMMHPKFAQKRVYLVRAFGEIGDHTLTTLKKGAMLDGEWCKFESLEVIPGRNKNHSFKVTLREGKYREVRRLFEQVGLTVSRLKRIQYGQYSLPRQLALGAFQKLILN